jgi:hypothetical protein
MSNRVLAIGVAKFIRSAAAEQPITGGDSITGADNLGDCLDGAPYYCIPRGSLWI